MNMADNHMFNLYFHNKLKRGGNNFTYFDYDVKNKISILIKADTNVEKVRVARKLKKLIQKAIK